jgi:hypothetical protein
MQAAQGHVPELGAAVWVEAQNFGCIHHNDRLSASSRVRPLGSPGLPHPSALGSGRLVPFRLETKKGDVFLAEMRLGLLPRHTVT